jgi:hypothetical protein
MEIVHHKWLNFGDNFGSWNLKRISKMMMGRINLLKLWKIKGGSIVVVGLGVWITW